MTPDISKEIIFQTARSGGKGGQNVNKVETMVEGYFNIRLSARLTEEQKDLLEKKLAAKINTEGYIQIRSQVYRSQLDNKKEVIRKMHHLLEQNLRRQKKRIPTRPSARVKEKRIEFKKRVGETKQARRKIRGEE